jgi:drug/metabolite transporter (DMT)-like permease
MIGLIVLVPGLFIKPPIQTGGKFLRLAFRGIMGTIALYTLLYCVLHIPLGTAMSYNLTSALFIAIFSFFLFREYHGRWVVLAVLLGFSVCYLFINRLCISPGTIISLVYYLVSFLQSLI